jgi:hypothetical protein
MCFKSMLGIRIRIKLDPDLFYPIRILERTLEVRGTIFTPRSQRVREFWFMPLLVRYSVALRLPSYRDIVPLQI